MELANLLHNWGQLFQFAQLVARARQLCSDLQAWWPVRDAPGRERLAAAHHAIWEQFPELSRADTGDAVAE